MKLPASNALNNRKLQRLGSALSILLIVWIAWILFQERDRLQAIDLNLQLGIAAALTAGIVVLGNFIGSLAMYILLRRHSPEFSLAVSVVINGMAQLAKYLPGNVLHLVGRYLYIQRLTSSGIALWFTVFEMLLLALAGAAIGMFYLHYLDPHWWSLPLAALVSTVLVLAGIAALTRSRLLDCRPQELALVVLLFLVSYGCYGFAFSQLMQHGLDQEDPGTLLCASLFALAFLGGYVTPGASGGMGVREFLLMALAAPLLDSTAVLAAAVLFRFLSITGDLLFGLAAFAVKLRLKQPLPG